LIQTPFVKPLPSGLSDFQSNRLLPLYLFLHCLFILALFFFFLSFLRKNKGKGPCFLYPSREGFLSPLGKFLYLSNVYLIGWVVGCLPLCWKENDCFVGVHGWEASSMTYVALFFIQSLACGDEVM
jgi:hypothetical protein